ncbi:hypothetical protein FA15DRAFT_709557 [Coprinopsis marcescibilis]|uniref:Uncharacterized protein n=1 Tax=Coprinopsis marcescibilis TaxID=230819 RepID=A0A5C3KG00_COPMA|nr:hypothetical protein FA15DRAFT_709557 [Coprinopsis marcescibilis]
MQPGPDPTPAMGESQSTANGGSNTSHPHPTPANHSAYAYPPAYYVPYPYVYPQHAYTGGYSMHMYPPQQRAPLHEVGLNLPPPGEPSSSSGKKRAKTRKGVTKKCRVEAPAAAVAKGVHDLEHPDGLTHNTAVEFTAEICGVGPSETISTEPCNVSTTSEQTSTTSPPLRHRTTATANDVWFFMRALDTKDEPLTKLQSDPILTDNPGPQVKYVGCKLCLKWKVWKHGYGMTATYRTHLVNYHGEVYKRTVLLRGLKGAKDIAEENLDCSGELMEGEMAAFTKQQFWYLLMKWIAADD